MDMNVELWETMSTYLSEIFPRVHRQFMKYDLPEGLSRMSGAFMGCAVNLGDRDTPVKTKPHRDVKERAFGVSCLCPFGDYSGGALILWELKVVIELAPGDLLYFPDSLIHHSNETVIGDRHSVVAFTQQNMFDYWRRAFGFVDHANNELKIRKKKLKRLKNKK